MGKYLNPKQKLTSGLHTSQALGEAPENIFNFYASAGKKINLALRIYRFASLILTSLFFLLLPSELSLQVKAVLVGSLLLSAGLMVFLYERFHRKKKLFPCLVILELVGLYFLLAFTGGIYSPFLWYALNPLILTALYLPFFLLWIFLGIFLLVALREPAFSYVEVPELAEGIAYSASPVLPMIIVLLVLQIFVRLYLVLSEHTYRAELQQKELFSAYQDLSEHYHIIQGLSKFQREVVSYQDNRDIFKSLIEAVCQFFPFREAVVLPAGETANIWEESVSSRTSFTSSHDSFTWPHDTTLEEIQLRWPEFSRLKDKNMVTGENRDWIAIPLRSHYQSIYAIFIGWLKPKANPYAFTENLFLFVKYAEQAMQRLHIFHQNEQNLKQLSSLYAAVETISSRNTPQEVTDLFAAYGRTMTGCDKVILWMDKMEIDGIEQQPVYSVKGKKDNFPEDEWQDTLLKTWAEISVNPEPLVQQLSSRGKNSYLISVPVKSGARCYGLLCGIHSQKEYLNHDIMQTLTILGDLTAIAVERNLVNLFDSKLLLLDEQNRIAGEIHDTISQSIFSIVYGIDALAKEAANSMEEKYRESLFSIRNLASETARELRLVIYRLSPRKRGDETFLQEIKAYLGEVARLNQVSINFDSTGKEEFLNPAIRKGFYRIIKEAIGNSIRHGKSREIFVKLEMTPFRCLLTISDDGKGFKVRDYQEMYSSGNQLGLVNMRELAISLQGSLNIQSEPEKGTIITCSVPTSPLSRGSASR